MRSSPIVILCACLTVLAVGCGPGRADNGPAPANPAAAVAARPPAVAGQFYEGQPFALQAQVEGLFRAARRTGDHGRLVAAVAPHAGYVFSGKTAASVYAAVGSNQYKRIIVLGPSHHVAFAGIALPDSRYDAYRTPLGTVPIDRAVCEALARQPGFAAVTGAETREHSVEVQLPFLQTRAGSFKLVPLVCGMIPDGEIAGLAKALVPFLDADTLLVASSDFTHYGPNYDFVPFDQDVPARLHGWLKEASGRIAALDLAGFLQHCRETRDTICGERPIAVVLSALAQQGAAVQGIVLDSTTSGDVVGDFRNSVSYAAIGFFATNAAAAQPAAAGTQQEKGAAMTTQSGAGVKKAFSISPEGQAKLLAIARQAIEEYLKTLKPKALVVSEPELTAPAAVFVTLTQQGELRGCIGMTEARSPLYQAVSTLAVSAAVEDGRFQPLTLAELPRTHIEISVLSPLERVKDAGAIKPGEHGVVVRRGWHQGLFLPQVWDHFKQGPKFLKDDFLNELCWQKAHLDPAAWKEPDTELYVFTVFAFEEGKK